MKDLSVAVCALAVTLAVPAGSQTMVDLRTQGKSVDFSAASSTKPFRTGTQLPPSCSLGESFFKTDAPAGQNWYGCTAANVWTLQSGASGVPAMGGQAGKVLSNDGTAAGWRALGGDIGGPPDAATVTGLRGRTVAATAPTDGQVLRWNGTSSRWEPNVGPSSGAVNYSGTFTGQTAVSVPGSTHGLGTANLIVSCYDNGSPAKWIEPDSVTVHPSTYDVSISFATAQSGRCVLNGSGAGGFAAATNASNTFVAGTVQTFQGALVASDSERTAPAKAGTALPPTCTPGDQFFKTDTTAGQNLFFCTGANSWTQMTGAGGSAVTSVFGRAGAVGAQPGDYSFGQLAGTVSDSQIAPAVNANKIGAGTVSNTAFGYLTNVSGDIQTQLNNKAAASHSHTGGGDLAGDLGNATVTRIRARAVSTAVPSDGQALVWNTAANAWQPGTVSGGGGGAGMASELNDFGAALTSATVLTIGGNCSTTTPCNVRFGNTTYSFTRSCTATIGAGTGTALIYVSSGGTLTIGHNLTVSASAGCMAQPSVTAFPAEAVPLYTWTAASGAWDSGGGRDYRAFLSQKTISAGTGAVAVESGGRTTLGVDTATVPTFLTGTSVMNFPSIPGGSCSADLSFTAPGAAVNDAVAPGWPSGLEPGLLGVMRVSAANTIAVRLCNVSSSPIDPVNATFRATIVRSF